MGSHIKAQAEHNGSWLGLVAYKCSSLFCEWGYGKSSCGCLSCMWGQPQPLLVGA